MNTHTIRTMTWNLWWRFGGNWRDREPGIISTLESVQPDLVGMQEVWGQSGYSQAAMLAARLKMHAGFAAPSLPPVPQPAEAPDQENVQLGVAVLSRWPLLAMRKYRLPSRHRDRPVALLATVDHPAGPMHFMVSCTEWEPAFAADHLAQTLALAALLDDPGLNGPTPVVLAADLNASPDSRELQPLVGPMVDTWTAGGGDPDAVTLDSALPFAPLEAEKQIDRRIDYVFFRPGSERQRVDVPLVFIESRPHQGLAPSDHYAVVADLAFREVPT